MSEELATFANSGAYLAYISLASGSEDVWLYDFASEQQKRLTNFNDGRHYIDITWTPDDQYLMGLTLNEIHKINLLDGSYETLNLPQKEMRGMSFKDNNTIAFSVKEAERWRVYSYDLETGITIPEDPKWQFIQFDVSGVNTIWMDTDEQLYAGDKQFKVSSNVIPPDSILYGRKWNLQKVNDVWYWFYGLNDFEIKRFVEGSEEVETILKTGRPYFDIHKEVVVYGVVEQINSNLYQTKRVN